MSDITLSDETIEKLARQIVAHERVGRIKGDNDTGVVRNASKDSRVDVVVLPDDDLPGFEGAQFSHERDRLLIAGVDSSTAEVDDSHVSPSGVGSAPRNADASTDTVGDAPDAKGSPLGVSGAPSTVTPVTVEPSGGAA